MARPSKAEQLKAVHEAALIEFDRVQSAQRDERLQCLQDRRFYSISGAQWEGPLGAQFENKPKFEVNKIHLSVIRIINEYRNNRITVEFQPKDSAVDEKLAETCNGLYRADEQYPNAEEAYDNAFEEAVAGGFGAWRLRAEYEDDEDAEDERQKICIEPIFDADTSVYFDLQAKRQDKADAKKCWVLTSMTYDDYEDEYGEDPSTWPKEVFQNQFDWLTPDVVYVAEYYVAEEVRDTIHVFEKLDGSEERLTNAELEDTERVQLLQAAGAKDVRQKKIKKKQVHKYIMSGAGVLEDCGLIAGSCIPIVPVYGKRWFVDNVERCMGHVRLAKDAQRLKNMQLSKLGEISAVSTVEKPILTPEQIAGHQVMWSEDNIKSYPYLLVNPMVDANGNKQASGPVAYTRAPQIPAAMAALLQITEEDIGDLLGNQQQGEEIQGNVSTETAHLIQNRLDMQTFIYMSNMAKAVKRCGEIWLSMAKALFIEEGRELKAVGYQGELSRVKLQKRAVNPDTGAMEIQNDLTKAKMDVVVEVGPSSSTKRAATVRALAKMAEATDDPETKQVLSAMAMMNMEGEGVQDVRDYFRKKLIKMGVVKPNEQETKDLQQELQNTPPDPQAEYLKAAALSEQSKAAKNQADIAYTAARAESERADAVKTMSEVDKQRMELAMALVNSFAPQGAPAEAAEPGEPAPQAPQHPVGTEQPFQS